MVAVSSESGDSYSIDGGEPMEKSFRSHVPAVVACSYAAIVVCLFALAAVTTDEFGFRFLPALFAAYPSSFLLYKHFDLSPAILAGGVINSVLLFVVFNGVALFRSSSARN